MSSQDVKIGNCAPLPPRPPGLSPAPSVAGPWLWPRRQPKSRRHPASGNVCNPHVWACNFSHTFVLVVNRRAPPDVTDAAGACGPCSGDARPPREHTGAARALPAPQAALCGAAGGDQVVTQRYICICLLTWCPPQTDPADICLQVLFMKWTMASGPL